MSHKNNYNDKISKKIYNVRERKIKKSKYIVYGLIKKNKHRIKLERKS